MSKFDDLLTEIESGIEDLAKTSAKDYIDEIKKDGSAFLTEIEEDLKRWTTLLANGDITGDEFKLLIESNRALLEMKALTKAGMAKKRTQDIIDGIIDIVTKAGLGLI
jgi:hypothetical protein